MNKKVLGGVLQASGIIIGGGLGGFCAYLGMGSGLLFPAIAVAIFGTIGLLLFLAGRQLVRSGDRDNINPKGH